MKIELIILITLSFSCTTLIRNHANCIESKIFKEKFFNTIEYIEENIFTKQDSSFKKALIFISNYAPVSFHETVNYARIYPKKVLERDKLIWLEWYEKNKCNNIQLKKYYPIPDKYKEFFE